MTEKSATPKGTWALMAALAVAVAAFVFFKVRSKMERDASAKCRTSLKTISGLLGAYKGSHQGQFPPDLASLESVLSSTNPERWRCPSDKDQSSYVFTFPGPNGYDKQAVFIHCRTHGHVCLAGGAVQSSTGAESE